MRAEAILLLVLAMQIVLVESDCSVLVQENDKRLCCIELNAKDALAIPEGISAKRAEGNATIDNSFKYIPVYSTNQIISGSLQEIQNCRESSCSERSNKSLCLSPFSMESFFSALPDAAKIIRKDCARFVPDGNCTNKSRFQITNSKSGMYIAYAIKQNISKALAAAPLLITEGQIILTAPTKMPSEEQYIQLKVNTTANLNCSKFFAAFMISRRDYNNISLSISKNESREIYDLVLSLNGKSMELPSDSKISSELLMNMLPLLPRNSAVGLQESNENGADLILLTDRPWDSGDYILTCCVYSPGKGLLGIAQSTIEII